MGKRPAGHGYPHVTTAAREADHRFCPVLAAVLRQVEAGKEPWGTLHELPPVATEAQAIDAKQGLYRARSHTGRKRGSCGDRALSIRATYSRRNDGTYTVRLQVWDRAAAKAEIIRRVNAGEALAYNVRRRKPPDGTA